MSSEKDKAERLSEDQRLEDSLNGRRVFFANGTDEEVLVVVDFENGTYRVYTEEVSTKVEKKLEEVFDDFNLEAASAADSI